MSVKNQISSFLQSRLNRWLARRIPQKKSHRLQHNNIFILPAKAGMGFILLILLLWLLGTNYQNNLVLGVAFLLLALMVVCIHHTYGNLSGLEVSVLTTCPGFVGQSGQVDLLVKRRSDRCYHGIELFWPEGGRVTIGLIDDTQTRITLNVPITARGWFQPPRLRVQTGYPLGLLYAWSHLDLDAPILAYPQPVSSSVRPAEQVVDDADEVGHQQLRAGHEEFAGLREYQPGDSLKTIDWRVMARGQGLATRTYEDYASQYYWLDWRQFEGLSREARLSRLCACVLQCADTGDDYGLHLPGCTVPPGQGEAHQQRVLAALALFEWEAG